jgi:hypothetical protein
MDGSQSTAVKHLGEAEAELAAIDARRPMLESELATIVAKRPVLVAEIVALRDMLAKLGLLPPVPSPPPVEPDPPPSDPPQLPDPPSRGRRIGSKRDRCEESLEKLLRENETMHRIYLCKHLTDHGLIVGNEKSTLGYTSNILSNSPKFEPANKNGFWKLADIPANGEETKTAG